jgi:hypothetical protein
MAKVGKNNKYAGGFERFTKKRLSEKDVERHVSRSQQRNVKPQRPSDDFFSSYEESDEVPVTTPPAAQTED